MNTPAFITFTGIDDHTDLRAARQLATDYPVEFGVLFSPERQGVEPRYPSWTTIYRFTELVPPGERLSAHLCGGYSRQLLASASTGLDSLLLDHFTRAQINTSQKAVDTAAVAQWAEGLDVTPILQCREVFPLDGNVDWLFDASGGRGILPAAWPPGPPTTARPIGYAGGLGPDNVAAAVEVIGAAASLPYWIDMESGVRTDDRFDLTKCRAVCEAVFGA